MKVTKQRNPYFKRISSSNPHKYSFDIQTGKYFLHQDNALDMEISKIGTLKPKFKHYFSGFANHKERYNQSLKQPTHMHYVPDLKYHKSKSYYTPMPDKFAGYTQYPYKLKKQFPQHLGKTSDLPKSTVLMRKCQSQYKKQLKAKNNSSIILQHSTTTFLNKQEKDKYFSMSFTSMTQSKPLPKNQKRTCYNYKCKYMKHFVFEQKRKNQQSTKYSQNSFTNTFGRSFHQSSLNLENQESKLIQQMN